MGYLKMGDSIAIWGRLNKDASYREFDSGARVASFSLKYGTEEKLYGENGSKKGKYMDIKCWGDLSDYARYLEAGDTIFVAGQLKLDKKPDKNGNDRWYLNAEFVTVQPTVQAEEEPVFNEEDPAPEEPLPQEFQQDEFPEVLQ